MNHSVVSGNVLDYSFWLLSQSDEVDAILRQNDEIVGIQQEAKNWGLPELEAFMPILDELSLQVDHENIERINSN